MWRAYTGTTTELPFTNHADLRLEAAHRSHGTDPLFAYKAECWREADGYQSPKIPRGRAFVEVEQHDVRVKIWQGTAIREREQARNLVMDLDGHSPAIRFVIRDRDAKFSRSFDSLLRAEGMRVIRTPIRAPNANAHAERVIETIRAECLDWTLIQRLAASRSNAPDLCRARQPRAPASRPRPRLAAG
jgi:hypothetical protein